MDANPRVAVGDIVRRVCLTAHEDLETMSRAVAALDDNDRKNAIRKYLKNVRHRFIKLLVLIKWACESGRFVDDLLALQQDFGMNEVRVFESVAALRRSGIVLHTARAPVYDVANAVDVLSSGTYLRLPRAIAKLSGNPRLDDRLPEMNESETLRKLEQYILERLLHQKAPPQFTTFRIDHGTLVCRVEHEFEVVLTLSGAALDSPWVVLSVAILVAGDASTSNISSSEDVERAARKDSAKQSGTGADEDDADDAVVAMLDDDGSDASDKGKGQGASATKKKRKRVDERDASSAFRPKKAAVLYLLRVLQQRLLSTKTPLKDVYEVVHTFCASVSIKMLEAQARELTENHWKFGKLLVKGSPQGTSLELQHWDNSCTLRICFDASQREGQLFVELDPPIDTSVTRSSIAAALVADAHTLPRRQLQVPGPQGADGEDALSTSPAAHAGSLVDGLCPSALNVEKVLLLGALAHAESRLNQIGLAVDELLFELETSASLARIERPTWALSQFRNTPSIVTQANEVALHIGLPVERTLEVTVEMRSGELLLSLLRKAKGAGGYRSARRWGASTDLLLLSAVERQIAKENVAKAASGIVRALFLLSVHAILESVELACEELQLPTSRCMPFILEVDPEQGAGQMQRRQAFSREDRRGAASSSPPCIFIRLSAVNDHEYYLCVGGRGISKALFSGISDSDAVSASSSAGPNGVRAEAGVRNGTGPAADASSSSQLEWLVVGGPARKPGQSVCVKRSALLRAGPLPGMTENFSSDATVRATLEAARARALSHVTTMQTTFLSRSLRCPTRRVAPNTIAMRPSRLISAAFGDKAELCIQLEPGDVLHLDVRAAPATPALPFGKPPALLAMAAAEREAQYVSAPADDDTVRLRLRYVRAPAMTTAMKAIGPAGSNVDTSVAAMHEILARAMLMLQGGHADGCVRFGQEPTAPAAKVMYAGPDGVAVHASHEGLTVDALVTFAEGAFSVTLLGGLSLPWVHEIVTLLNVHIRPDLLHVDWDAVQQVARQVLASLAFGLPTVKPIREALTSKPDKLLGSQPETPLPGSTPGGTPGPGGRTGGKFGLSMRIMSQKASANQGARIVTLLPLSHLRMRLFVGEIHRVDLTLTVEGVKFNSLYANNAIKEDVIVPYNQFSRKLKSCLSTVLGAS
ncbi:Mediator of RNA polymerase II transcription subunit 14 [Hondaea fermentalgiana]|uniref:Mediator of RNA polymerase II transcription subunit 14 n=1 Tax=Hondaea fermentalgiana TaxID=2315210 RepID=A0A2R5G561_9STRA|nr:Mediator of RNA polymerase II transcription subunit 14 [Hondaea fermentalgiana]|eukprot:GBG26172.1 Mediator of RNA polymerase II transcription subunit 14 [Hondaea fermentalgiana]